MNNFETLTMQEEGKVRRLMVHASAPQIVFEVGFEATDRWQAIPKMVDAMFHGGALMRDQTQQLAAVLLKRETSMSTGIGFGIAMPHASSDLVENIALGFFRVESGMNWDALDNQPIFIACCFIVPQGQFQKHLFTLAGIAKSLHRADYRAESMSSSLEEWCSLTCRQVIGRPSGILL